MVDSVGGFAAGESTRVRVRSGKSAIDATGWAHLTRVVGGATSQVLDRDGCRAHESGELKMDEA